MTFVIFIDCGLGLGGVIIIAAISITPIYTSTILCTTRVYDADFMQILMSAWKRVLVQLAAGALTPLDLTLVLVMLDISLRTLLVTVTQCHVKVRNYPSMLKIIIASFQM